jgi:hypothetical protein
MHNKLYYLVDWLGYAINDRTWEPTKNVANAPQDILSIRHLIPIDKYYILILNNIITR